jgi:hypothetical protein
MERAGVRAAWRDHFILRSGDSIIAARELLLSTFLKKWQKRRAGVGGLAAAAAVGAQRTRFLGHFFVAHKEVAEETERKNGGSNNRQGMTRQKLPFPVY